MSDEMFFSKDGKGLRRGRRTSPRTETCRPCRVWHAADPEHKFHGVVLDVTPHGMLVRMIETIGLGAKVKLQLMRDEEFNLPLTDPVNATIVRYRGQPGRDGFTDHGIRLAHPDIQREPLRPVQITRPKPMPRRRVRMHTLDVTLGDRDNWRTGR